MNEDGSSTTATRYKSVSDDDLCSTCMNCTDALRFRYIADDRNEGRVTGTVQATSLDAAYEEATIALSERGCNNVHEVDVESLGLSICTLFDDHAKWPARFNPDGYALECRDYVAGRI